MPAKILRLEHAELCAGCTDLLSTGTAVHVHDDGMVTCLACDGDDLVLDHRDPWAGIDDVVLHGLLQRRQLVAAA